MSYGHKHSQADTHPVSELEIMQYTFSCNSNLTILTQSSQTITHKNKPTHCICCNKPCTPQLTTGWDYYGIQLNATSKYAFHMLCVLPRQLNATNINLINSAPCPVGFHSPHYTKGHFVKSNIPDEPKVKITSMTDAQLAEHTFRNLPSNISYGITLVNATCNSCQSQFTFEHTHKNTINSPLKFCPYCGTESLSLNQASDELTYWTSLARHYNKPIPVIKACFMTWQQVTNFSSFSQYMAALPAILEIELTYNPVKTESFTYRSKSTKKTLKTRKIHTVKLILPIQAKSLPSINKPIEMYNKCKLCECDQPSKTLAAYCEPCYLFQLTQRFTLNSKGGC